MLGHGFFKPTPGRLRLICWTCNREGHRAVARLSTLPQTAREEGVGSAGNQDT